MERVLPCSWWWGSESRAAGPQPDGPPAAQVGSERVVCPAWNRSQGECMESRLGIGLMGTLPHPKLFLLPGRPSPHCSGPTPAPFWKFHLKLRVLWEPPLPPWVELIPLSSLTTSPYGCSSPLWAQLWDCSVGSVFVPVLLRQHLRAASHPQPPARAS